MQNNAVKAFRQRLVRGGFTDISIFDVGNDEYVVYCTDREGKDIRKRLTIAQMDNIPRTVYFDD